MPVNGVDSDRNYSSIINGGGTSLVRYITPYSATMIVVIYQ